MKPNDNFFYRIRQTYHLHSCPGQLTLCHPFIAVAFFQWKKTLSFCLLASFCVTSFAQGNNPYNRRGADYLKSLEIISGDYHAGKVKEFSEETLQQYSKIIPLENMVSSEIVSTIIKTTKSPGFNFGEYIDKSKASEYIKASFRDIYKNFGILATDEYKSFLTKKVEEARFSECTDAEREFLLSVIAIVYHVSGSEGSKISIGGLAGRYRADCTVDGNPAPCWVVGAVVGGVIGFEICGLLCGIGGAIIGGVIGSFS